MTTYSGPLDASGTLSFQGHSATFSAELNATIESRVDSFGNGFLEETIKGTISADVDGEAVSLPLDYTAPWVQISQGHYAISQNETLSYYGLDLNLNYALSGSFSANQAEISAAGSINATGSYLGIPVSGAAYGSEQLAADHLVSISSMAATPSAPGVLGIGQTVAIDVQLGSGVTVSGDARLRLSDGGIAHYDAFRSDASGGLLVFDYTVGKGQVSSNLKVLGVLLPGGASIDTSYANGADLAISAAKAALHLAVDGSPPKVGAVKSTSSAHGSEARNGDTVTITLKLTEAVKVSGLPTLTLDDGGVATWDPSLSSAKSLVFTYVVGTESTKDLKIAGIDLSSGAAIVDSAGNALSTNLTSNLHRSVNVAKAAHAASPGDFVFDPTSGAVRLGAHETGRHILAVPFERHAGGVVEFPHSLGASAAASAQTDFALEAIGRRSEILLGAHP